MKRAPRPRPYIVGHHVGSVGHEAWRQRAEPTRQVINRLSRKRAGASCTLAQHGRAGPLTTRLDSRRFPHLLPYGARGSCRLDLLEIAVVRVQEANARAVHSNAEDDLDDSGLVDGSWRRRQEDTASLYRCTFSRRGVDRGRFSPRQGRKELLQKFKREGLSVHERILLQTSLRALVQCLLDGFHTLRFLPSNLIAHERSGWAFMCSSPQFHDGRAQGRQEVEFESKRRSAVRPASSQGRREL
jgi:hypothetical protein